MFKASILVSLLIASTHSISAFAAVEDTLNLPPANRAQALKNTSSSVYAELREISFSTQYPMSLRWKAIMGMAEARDTKSIADLQKAIESKEWFVRNAALIAMAKVNSTQATQWAQRLLVDPALVVRSAAVEVLNADLSKINRSLYWQELDNKMNFRGQQSLWIRHQMAKALAQNPLENEKWRFARWTQENDETMQDLAITAFERIEGLDVGAQYKKMNRQAKLSFWSSKFEK